MAKTATLTIDQIIEELVSSGILDDSALADIRRKASEGGADGPEQFVKQLIVDGHLTAFQAKRIWIGRGQTLTLGNYILLDELGRGGMGVVLKAVHRRMQREVAIKVLPAEMTKDAAAIARFQREVVAAAQLAHTNIVAAFDADEINGQHLLVMEFVDGRDLSSVVKKHGPVSVNQAIDCILQAARGLEYAHGRGVIHRDIKPANLLLDKQGTVKILDMGLARFSESANVGTQAELTGTGAVMGTVDYMSPEQALSTKTADGRSDIYSLGISLYFLLTGKPAYGGETLMARLMAHTNEPIPSMLGLRDDVPQNVQTVFAKMVAKKPAERYQTMSEVIGDLETCRTDDTGKVLAASAPVSGGEGEDGLTSFLKQLDEESAGQSVQGRLPSNRGGRASSRGGTGVSAETSSEPSETIPDAKLESVLSQVRRGDWARVARSRPLWISGVLGLLLLLLIVAFPFHTSTGTLQIEILDPDIEVSVNGTPIVLKGLSTKQFVLTPGKHTLRVTHEDFSFETRSLELERGEEISVRVEVAGDQVQVVSRGKLIGHTKLNRDSGIPTETSSHVSTTGGPAKHTAAFNWPTGAPPPAIAPFDAEQAKAHQEAWAKYLDIPVECENTLGMKFRLIPPGEFLMGNTPEEINAVLKVVGEDQVWRERIQSEAPQHRVILTQPVYVGVTEVTQTQYQQVMGTDLSELSATDSDEKAEAGLETEDYPIETASWSDAVEFCAKLSQLEQRKPLDIRSGDTVESLDGLNYRLPTEAEWEYACRAGTTTRFWSGDQDEDLLAAGWFGRNSGGQVHAVGEREANAFGLSDAHGNVWEWTQDGWDPEFYSKFAKNPAVDPLSPYSAGSGRVSRGGSWRADGLRCRSSNRHALSPTSHTGFRVVLVADSIRKTIEDRMAESSENQSSNWALRFDAYSSVVVDSLLYNGDIPLTLEFTIRSIPIDGSRGSLVCGWRDVLLVNHRTDDSKMEFNWNSTAGNVPLYPSPQPLADSQTTHFAYVYDGVRVSVFENGRRAAGPKSVYNNRHAEAEYRPAFVLGMGWNVHAFSGVLDEIRISRGAVYRQDYTPQPRLQRLANTIALYHCDAGSGDTLHDSSGNDHHGRILNANWVPADRAVDGKVDADPPRSRWALSFDGKDDCIYGLPHVDLAAPFTLEAITTVSQDVGTIDGSANILGNPMFGLRSTHKRTHWEVGVFFKNSDTRFRLPIVSPKLRTHLALQSDGETLWGFVNGRRIGESVWQVAPLTTSPTVGADIKGEDDGVPSRFDNGYRGLVFGVRISDNARYSNDFTPPDSFESDSHTTALYLPNEGDGNVVKDASGNGFTGNVIGATWVRVDQ